jgi:hypothetical protein
MHTLNMPVSLALYAYTSLRTRASDVAYMRAFALQPMAAFSIV